MEPVVAYRIKNARKLNCLSQQELADRIGVSKQMISKYEMGKSIPDSTNLLKLSKVFELKVDYFFRSFQVELDQVNFRKKSKLSVKKLDSIKELIKIKLENYLWLEDVLSIDFSFKNIIKDKEVNNLGDVETLVLRLRNHWKIGIDPIHNIIELLEDKGIKIIELEETDDKFDGLACFINNKFPIIVINKNFPVERKRFTLLHELGHLLLNLPDCETAKEEKFCNKFAAEFLLPKNIVIQEFGGKRNRITLPELISTQMKYGISIPAIIYRLVDAEIIPQTKLKQFYQKLNTNTSLKDKVNTSRFGTEEFSNRYLKLVYRALSEEQISTSKAAALLNTDLETVRENFNEL